MNLFRKKDIDKILVDAREGSESHLALNRNLGVRDLTAFGIAAIVGAGIFSTIGVATSEGGPAVVFLFVFTAFACACSGFAYAEFASLIPVSGSAYTYSYAAFGELIAWIIGWDLLIEYAIGNVAVAISWSDYFTSLLANIHIDALNIHGIHLPAWITMDYLSASRGYQQLIAGAEPTSLLQDASAAWTSAPIIGGLRIIADIPALCITLFITYLIYIGIKESKQAGNIMVLVKVIIILLVISIGAFHIHTENWSPFAPNGIAGVLKGVSGVFFAYIGFDAISTTAEECKNPQRDLPRGMFNSILICTFLYLAIALVLTGMVNYKELNVGDPLAYAFSRLNLRWISVLVGFSAIVATASVLLVFQLGQPRIWMSMSRDGLLPAIFSRIHPKYKTPGFSTIVTGFTVAVPALFLNLTEMTELTSIGTLFAFILVCAGVLRLHTNPHGPRSKFKTPYINGKYIVPLLFIVMFAALIYEGKWIREFLTYGEWDSFRHKIPMYLFFVTFAYVSYWTFTKKLSLIIVFGLLTCLYLMAQLTYMNWLRFSIWLVVGLVIYFLYGYKHSKLNNK